MRDEKARKYTPEEIAVRREQYRQAGWVLADFSERPAPPAELVKEGQRVLDEMGGRGRG